MAWCPKCRLEYVEGIKICPDCKTALVDELTEENTVVNALEEGLSEMALSDDYNESDYYEEEEEEEENLSGKMLIEELIKTLEAKNVPKEEIEAIIESARRRSNNNVPEYKTVQDRYTENKSAAGVLIACGALGIIALLLNVVGILNLPFKGYSRILTYIVMGFLFLVFVFFGLKSQKTVKKLKPELEEEENNTAKLIDYLKEEFKKGSFDITDDNNDISYEEKSLMISSLAVNACEKEFEELKPGFAYYVVDRFYSDIFEEDSDIFQNED